MAMIDGVRALDVAFADWLADGFVDDEARRDGTRRLAAAVSHALHLKHTCLDLDRYPALETDALNGLLDTLGPEDARSLPPACCAVVPDGSGDEVAEDEPLGASPATAPLVRTGDGARIWLQKYYRFERTVARRVHELSGRRIDVPAAVITALDKLYPVDGPSVAATDSDQRAAVRTALERRLAVITGGPGTGKTWTVARLIALLLHGDPALRVALTAPTGKAANRMMESLDRALHSDAALAAMLGDTPLPAKARTLHSLLGIYRYSPKPRFDATRPLPLDVVIVDEASMIDLPMMARLLDALPDRARLVLLGDRDQLASVEAGGVLAELCRTGPGALHAGGVDAPVTELRTNHRSILAIHDLALAVNAGERPGATALDNEHVSRVVTSPDAAEPAWLGPATDHFQALVESLVTGAGVDAPLSRLSSFQLLCALRAGPAGVAGINARMERRFGPRQERETGRAAFRERQAWYPGLPLMVTANDHDRKLYNGDVGLVLPVRETRIDDAVPGRPNVAWEIDLDSDDWRACFPGATARVIRYAQMPPFETAYAMTVHKSQGSEYDAVSLVLPDDAEQTANNPVLTRELLYTAITRAARSLEIHAGAGVLEAMIARRTVRMSGLSPR